MDYSAAAAYLAGLTDYEISPATAYNAANFDLRRVETLLKTMDRPQKGRKTVHIAGTKGKGSTAAMISSILASAGQCTGLFTSPHLYTWQERIAINGRPVTKRDFAGLAGAVRTHVEAINREARFGKITTFEALTAMAVLHFRHKGAAFQVLETGMGGRLDATNVVGPDVCIITSISFDHTQVLGNTLAQIAAKISLSPVKIKSNFSWLFIAFCLNPETSFGSITHKTLMDSFGVCGIISAYNSQNFSVWKLTSKPKLDITDRLYILFCY